MASRLDSDVQVRTEPFALAMGDGEASKARTAATEDASCLGHPAQHLSLYFAVPLLINGATALYLTRLNPDATLLLVRLPGILVGISWGWAGLLLCILLGVMLGLPVAAFQAAYVRCNLAEVTQGTDLPKSLYGPTAALALNLPWLIATPIAYLVGHFWLFPPLGGPLLAANVLWVRVLLYGQHLRIHQYQQAYLEQQRTTGCVSEPA